MMWAIKHKSGRVLFVTSDEFIAENRRKMGWIVEKVKMMSREKFEEYAAGRLGLPIEMIFDARNGDRYLHAFDSMNVMQPLNGWWAIWQASRAAIEVELPQRYDIQEMSSNPWDSYRCIEEVEGGDYVHVEDIISTIEQLGLKVKK